MKIDIKFFNTNAKLPTKSHELDAGLDIYMPNPFTIESGETVCIGTGLGFKVPKGYAAYFVPRSSMAKKGLVIGNALIDPGYTGETHLILTNTSKQSYFFPLNSRIGSVIFIEIPNVEFNIVGEFEKTERGNNGLGSSGN